MRLIDADAELLQAYKDTGLEPEEIDMWGLDPESTSRILQTIISYPLCLLNVANIVESLAPLFERMDGYGAERKIKAWTKAYMEGRLIVLPCKVGDRFWFIEDGQIREYLVGAFETTGYGDLTVYDYDGIDRDPAYFTREEAEAALERSKPHGD